MFKTGDAGKGVIKVAHIRLGRAGVLRDEHVLHIGQQAGALQPGHLADGVAVGDNVQLVRPGKVPHQLQRPGEQRAPLGQVLKVQAVDFLRLAGKARLLEEVLKAPHIQLGFGALPPLQLFPPAVVAGLVLLQQGGGVGPLAAKAGLVGGLEGPLHVPVKIQQGVVGVEKQKTIGFHGKGSFRKHRSPRGRIEIQYPTRDHTPNGGGCQERPAAGKDGL